MKRGWILFAVLSALVIFGFSAKDALADASVVGMVIDADDDPVAGAMVTIHQMMDRGDRGYSAETETDNDGAFQFNDVPAGNYIVTAMTRDLGGVREEVSVEDEDVQVLLQLDGRQGGGDDDDEVANVRGIVVTPDGDAVAGARVTLQRMNRHHDRRQEVLSTRSDREGHFAFRAVPVGTYMIHAVVRGGGVGQRIEVTVDGRNAVRLVIHRIRHGDDDRRGGDRMGDRRRYHRE